jgi:hypothetical protein
LILAWDVKVGAVTFTLELEREDDGRWLAEIPALAGVMWYGADRNDAVAASRRWPSASSPNAWSTERCR